MQPKQVAKKDQMLRVRGSKEEEMSGFNCLLWKMMDHQQRIVSHGPHVSQDVVISQHICFIFLSTFEYIVKQKKLNLSNIYRTFFFMCLNDLIIFLQYNHLFHPLFLKKKKKTPCIICRRVFFVGKLKTNKTKQREMKQALGNQVSIVSQRRGGPRH